MIRCHTGVVRDRHAELLAVGEVERADNPDPGVLVERLYGDLVELEGIAVTADECVTSLPFPTGKYKWTLRRLYVLVGATAGRASEVLERWSGARTCAPNSRRPAATRDCRSGESLSRYRRASADRTRWTARPPGGPARRWSGARVTLREGLVAQASAPRIAQAGRGAARRGEIAPEVAHFDTALPNLEQ